jgi:hypothetical protein
VVLDKKRIREMLDMFFKSHGDELHRNQRPNQDLEQSSVSDTCASGKSRGTLCRYNVGAPVKELKGAEKDAIVVTEQLSATLGELLGALEYLACALECEESELGSAHTLRLFQQGLHGCIGSTLMALAVSLCDLDAMELLQDECFHFEDCNKHAQRALALVERSKRLVEPRHESAFAIAIDEQLAMLSVISGVIMKHHLSLIDDKYKGQVEYANQSCSQVQFAFAEPSAPTQGGSEFARVLNLWARLFYEIPKAQCASELEVQHEVATLVGAAYKASGLSFCFV